MFEKSVVFICGTEEYAVPVEQVVSIEKVEHITPIPHLPNYLLGYTRIRGELVPVIDFQFILYGKSTEGDLSRIVVMNTDVINFGLVVAEAKEILDISPDLLKQIGLVNYAKTQYFTAVANLENRMITCVDPKVLVHSLEGVREIIEYMHSMEQDSNVNA
jgi:purine-binding chemotaxis protein CheW